MVIMEDLEIMKIEGYKHLKSSSKGRIILKRMNLGKYIFEKEKPKNLEKVYLKEQLV